MRSWEGSLFEKHDGAPLLIKNPDHCCADINPWSEEWQFRGQPRMSTPLALTPPSRKTSHLLQTITPTPSCLLKEDRLSASCLVSLTVSLRRPCYFILLTLFGSFFGSFYLSLLALLIHSVHPAVSPGWPCFSILSNPLFHYVDPAVSLR